MNSEELDAAYANLAAQERRDVMHQLANDDVESIHISKSDDPEWMLSLLHNHLPSLAEHGHVEYEVLSDSLTIRQGPQFRELEILLEASEQYREYVSE